MERAMKADAPGTSSTDRTKLGVHGLSLLVAALPYVDYNNLWLVPTGHSLLYGVVKSFVNHIFRQHEKFKADHQYPPDVIPHKGRSTIRKRANDIHVPSEFGRQYRCVETYRGSYKMEEWLHFVDTFSPYIFQDVLPTLLKEMWSNLVIAVRHYCRGFGYTDTDSQNAAEALMKYALALEENDFPDYMFTSNLHAVICRWVVICLRQCLTISL